MCVSERERARERKRVEDSQTVDRGLAIVPLAKKALERIIWIDFSAPSFIIGEFSSTLVNKLVAIVNDSWVGLEFRNLTSQQPDEELWLRWLNEKDWLRHTTCRHVQLLLWFGGCWWNGLYLRLHVLFLFLSLSPSLVSHSLSHSRSPVSYSWLEWKKTKRRRALVVLETDSISDSVFQPWSTCWHHPDQRSRGLSTCLHCQAQIPYWIGGKNLEVWGPPSVHRGMDLLFGSTKWAEHEKRELHYVQRDGCGNRIEWLNLDPKTFVHWQDIEVRYGSCLLIWTAVSALEIGNNLHKHLTMELLPIKNDHEHKKGGFIVWLPFQYFLLFQRHCGGVLPTACLLHRLVMNVVASWPPSTKNKCWRHGFFYLGLFIYYKKSCSLFKWSFDSRLQMQNHSTVGTSCSSLL